MTRIDGMKYDDAVAIGLDEKKIAHNSGETVSGDVTTTFPIVVMSNSEAARKETLEQQKQQQKQQPLLSKTDRKKLKKLKKRAHSVHTEVEKSGLLTRTEYEEFQRVVQLEDGDSTINNTMGPIIRIRKKKAGIDKAEGAHHRDLLVWMLQQLRNESESVEEDGHAHALSKKRTRGHNEGPSKVSIPHWASIHNPGTIEQLAVLEIHVSHADSVERYKQYFANRGLSPKQDDDEHQQKSRSSVSLRTKWFQSHVPLSMSESLFYFSNQSHNKSTKKSKPDGQNTSVPTAEEIMKRLENLLLTPDEMKREGFPQPVVTMDDHGRDFDERTVKDERMRAPDTVSLTTARDFVQSFGLRVADQDQRDQHPYICTCSNDLDDNSRPRKTFRRVFGLDCEMVMTELGLELARVTMIQLDEAFSAVDNQCKSSVVIDCLVRPENKVLDYLTRHSGITAKHLDPVETRLAQLQYSLAMFLHPDDILVGHSLENDLKAMHYIHHCVIDTAMVFRGRNQRTKFSLRHLTSSILKRKIQRGSHCSEEDAKATLDLAIQKAWLGDELKVPGAMEKLSILHEHCPSLEDGGAVFIGPLPWLENHVTNASTSAHTLTYDSVHDCQKAMISWMNGRRKARLVWTNVLIGHDVDYDASFDAFQTLTRVVLEKLPRSCVLAVAVQFGLEEAKRTFQQRRACQDVRSCVGWSEEKERLWQNQLDNTRYGFVQWFGS